jgi:predicted nucleic acid-binding protein
MTSVLLDTNVLLRYVEKGAADHAIARETVKALMERGEDLCVTPQVLIEFWVVVTRPVGVNGFGWTPASASVAVRDFLETFRLLPDSPRVFTRWLELVERHGVSGKRGHDVRLAAVMSCYGISKILTFNAVDFAGLDGITPVAPESGGDARPAD